MNFNTTRLKTLMLREWLQNRWLWMVAVAALPALTLIVLPFGDVQLPQRFPATLVMVAAVAISAMVCAGMAWLTTLFNATSLARRDVQDRSIEFWLSLPSTHAEHLGAQYLMHGLVFPVAAMLFGLLCGLLVAPLVLLKWGGLAALGAVVWPVAIAQILLAAALFGVGLAVFALWMAPLLATLMALSAWVKRLAMPILAVVFGFLANYPGTRDGFRALSQSFFASVLEPLHAMAAVMGKLLELPMEGSSQLEPMLPLQYLGTLFSGLASPQFAFALALTGLGAWALAVKRGRGG
jgi:ABC-2 type transport system permease protein